MGILVRELVEQLGQGPLLAQHLDSDAILRILEHGLTRQQGGNDQMLVVPGQGQLELAEQIHDELHDLVGLVEAGALCHK